MSHLYTFNTTNVYDAIYCHIHLFILNAPSTFPTAAILGVAAGLRFHPGSPDLKEGKFDFRFIGWFVAPISTMALGRYVWGM